MFVVVHLPMPRMDSVVSPKKEEINYAFVYIAHPRAVTGFSWRTTSKYMPRYTHFAIQYEWASIDVSVCVFGRGAGGGSSSNKKH